MYVHPTGMNVSEHVGLKVKQSVFKCGQDHCVCSWARPRTYSHSGVSCYVQN